MDGMLIHAAMNSIESRIINLVDNHPDGKEAFEMLEKVLRFLLGLDAGHKHDHSPDDDDDEKSWTERFEDFLVKVVMNFIQNAIPIIVDNIRYVGRLLLDAIEYVKSKCLTFGESEPSAEEPPNDLCPVCLKSLKESTDDFGIVTLSKCKHQFHFGCLKDACSITKQCIVCGDTGSK